jgi:hypothetical protein
MNVATLLLAIVAVLAQLGDIADGIQVLAGWCTGVRRRSPSRRRYHGRHADRGRGRVRPRRGMSMVPEDGPRWLVRLSVPRLGGVRAWGAASGVFERSRARQEACAVTEARIESETRRGRDFVWVNVVMTVAAEDVVQALMVAWRVFQRTAGEDLTGWDLEAASVEVQALARHQTERYTVRQR